MLYMNVLSNLSTQMSPDLLKKCNVFEKAMQLSIHDQHDAYSENKI